jgi:hypothetical protein
LRMRLPRNHPHWLTINGCESSHPRMVVVCGIVWIPHCSFW